MYLQAVHPFLQFSKIYLLNIKVDKEGNKAKEKIK